MSEPLSAAGKRILQCRGASYEGDAFSILKRSPYTVRSFEFGLADGAVDCNRSYEINTPFADRFWDVHERRWLPDEVSELVLFEVKSTAGSAACDQVYITSFCQRRHVAFYIGINAADPTYVELIPNYYQEAAALQTEDIDFTVDAEGKRHISVNVRRASHLPTFAYGGIDQSTGP